MQSIANVKKIKNIFSVSRLYLLFFPIIYSGLLTKIMNIYLFKIFFDSGILTSTYAGECLKVVQEINLRHFQKGFNANG